MKVTADNFFKAIGREPERFYNIHYSSQSLYDADSEGHSPRITSIAVMHFATPQTASFSVHAVADLLQVGKEDVESRYNDIDKMMLSRFFDFVKDRLDKYWIHRRTQNLTYGFEHLEHRSRLLENPEPPRVHGGGHLDTDRDCIRQASACMRARPIRPGSQRHRADRPRSLSASAPMRPEARRWIDQPAPRDCQASPGTADRVRCIGPPPARHDPW